jgi:hypothetical protein
VEQVSVEDEGGAGRKLDRNCVLLPVAESVSLSGAIEARVVLFSVRIEHAGPV